MKYVNNKIQYETGDWVYFLGNLAAYCTNVWISGLVLKVDVVQDGSLHFKDKRFFPYTSDSNGFSNATSQFRPATQAEIDEALKKLDPPIMLGQYEVKFVINGNTSNTYCDEKGSHTKVDWIDVGCVKNITEKQFKEIGKKAGWL